MPSFSILGLKTRFSVQLKGAKQHSVCCVSAPQKLHSTTCHFPALDTSNWSAAAAELACEGKVSYRKVQLLLFKVGVFVLPFLCSFASKQIKGEGSRRKARGLLLWMRQVWVWFKSNPLIGGDLERQLACVSYSAAHGKRRCVIWRHRLKVLDGQTVERWKHTQEREQTKARLCIALQHPTTHFF